MAEYELNETAPKSSFTDSLVAIPATISAKLPTMDKSLDRYFDAHMSMIIEEWGLITRHDLEDLDHRLQASNGGIGRLESGRERIEKRAAALEAEIQQLEGR
jgi:hypothetical protein